MHGKGITGYPIVIGMRELYETGWMHTELEWLLGLFS